MLMNKDKSIIIYYAFILCFYPYSLTFFIYVKGISLGAERYSLPHGVKSAN